MIEAYEGRDLTEATPSARAAPNLAEALQTIAVPTLVVTGEHDTPWLQLVGDALAYGLPNAERRIIPGAGHTSNLSHPDAFNAALSVFLGDGTRP